MKFGGSFSSCNPDSSQYVSVYGKVCCHCGISNSWLASPTIIVSPPFPQPLTDPRHHIKASSWEFCRGATAPQFWCTGSHLLTLCKQMLGFVLEEPSLAFGILTRIQLGHAVKTDLQRTSNNFWRTLDLHTNQFLSLTFDGAHYVTVYKGAGVHWKHYWASWSAIADKANTAGHLMDSVQTLPCHKMILTLQMKSPRQDGVTHKDMWVSQRELWKCSRLGHLSCDFSCLDTRSLCLYTGSKNTIRHKTPGWSTDVIKCH